VPSTFRKLEGDEAQTMVEYTVVLGVITLAIVTTFALLSGAIQSIFESVTRFFS
jgi:Flp pilus assembly pilin Flp